MIMNMTSGVNIDASRITPGALIGASMTGL